MRESFAGFTLVEMLIVVSVLVFLTAFLLSSNKSGQSQIALFREQTKLIGVLNQAKAMTLERTGGACGFGVYFPAAAEGESRRQYLLFQDNPSPTGGCPGDERYSGEIEKISSFTMDARISFTAPLPNTSIVFIAPYLETNLNGTADIVIQNLDGRRAAIFVTAGGQIGSLGN